MITLSASGGSVTFEFSGNSTYLNDGTITVPVNSLALIIDESDMATFRKAASNDIFVSANIAEFGMTKAELESWYKANMVGSTGGGGTDTGTVQTMIDQSISGKADSSAVTVEISAAVSGKANSSDVYTTGQTSGATEIANALSAKLDATAYTPTVVDATLSSSSMNPVQNKALYDELRVVDEIVLTFTDSVATNYPSGCTEIKVDASASGGMATIGFYDSNWSQIGGNITIDTLYDDISVENNFEGSTYTIDGNIVTISYPTVTNVEHLFVAGLDYTYKAVTSVSSLKDVVSGKTNQSDFTAYTASTDAAVSGKVDTSTYTAYTADTSTKVSSAWSKSIRDLAWYPTTSGLTLEYVMLSGGSYQYAVQPMDDSLTYDDKKLSVYATGNKGTVTMNLSQKTSMYYFPYIYWNLDNGTLSTTNDTYVLLELNPSFSGSVGSKAIGVIYRDGQGTQRTAFWDYNSGTDSFTLNSQSSSYDGVNLWYNSTNKTIQFSRNWFASKPAAWIEGVRCGSFSNYIAASSDPTDASCYVSYVKIINTKTKKLQEVLDTKQDTLSAGTGINISGNVISANVPSVTTAVTSGSTDVVTSGGVYAKMGGMTIVKITESEYAALSVKDPDTLYVVIPDPTNP